MRRILPLFLSTVTMLTVAAACRAQKTPEQPGPALLFAQDDGGLSVEERSLIYQGLGLKLDSAGTGFLDMACDQPAETAVTFSDWNSDGKKEVLVIFGNTCTSGMAGRSAALFIKDSTGAYAGNLGFSAFSVEPQATSNLGYPDLLIGGPGFCFPIWRWDGKAYDFLKSEPQSPGGCDNR